jgi:hypothetical protein
MQIVTIFLYHSDITYSSLNHIGIILLGDFMPISDENTRILITIPKYVHAGLKFLAKRQDRTVSNLVATLITRYVKRNLPDEK